MDGDDKDDDDDGVDDEADGSVVGMAMKETPFDRPQVCGRTASFDAIVNLGVSPESQVMEFSSFM